MNFKSCKKNQKNVKTIENDSIDLKLYVKKSAKLFCFSREHGSIFKIFAKLLILQKRLDRFS